MKSHERNDKNARSFKFTIKPRVILEGSCDRDYWFLSRIERKCIGRNDRRILRGVGTNEYVLRLHFNKFCKQSVIYGCENNLHRRTYEHKLDINDSFSRKYRTHKLVYYEEYKCPQDAIAREKQIKGLLRVKKIALIEEINPEWKDLSEEF